MEEKTVKEIEAGAKILGLTTEEANTKFAEICSESHIETNNPIGLGLWRNYVANAKRSASSGKQQQQSDSLFKPAFGFFLSLDAPRDMMSWNRNKAKEEYLRDSDNALENGIVAVATENALGKFTVSRYFNGNYEEKVVGTLPKGAETLDDGRIYIPLDATATYMNGGKTTITVSPYQKNNSAALVFSLVPLPVEKCNRISSPTRIKEELTLLQVPLNGFTSFVLPVLMGLTFTEQLIRLSRVFSSIRRLTPKPTPTEICPTFPLRTV